MVNKLAPYGSEPEKCHQLFIISGALLSMYRGWIGVPANYFYKTVDDIDKSKLFIRNTPIEWDQSIGQQLQDSLVLTEAEQTFAFCRSILELNSYRLYLNTIIGFGSVVATYTIGQYVNEKGKLFKRPFYVSFKLELRFGSDSFASILSNNRSDMRCTQWLD